MGEGEDMLLKRLYAGKGFLIEGRGANGTVEDEAGMEGGSGEGGAFGSVGKWCVNSAHEGPIAFGVSFAGSRGE
jgi:hypothetical protein